MSGKQNAVKGETPDAASELYPIMQKILLKDKEKFAGKLCLWCVGMGHDFMLQYVKLIYCENEDHISIDPVDVLKFALDNEAEMIILVQKRPLGELVSNTELHRFTKELMQAGPNFEIQVTEHLVINEDSFFSFERDGLIAFYKT